MAIRNAPSIYRTPTAAPSQKKAYRRHSPLMTRATEAIQIYWEVLRAERSPTSELREIEVELPV